MALQSDVIFEVDIATGDDDNGGGFDAVSGTPGTDYTQGVGQATFEWASAGGDFTNDLAATDASPSVLSSASRNFVAADVGNLIKITAGTNFVVGWYQVISVAANAATLDRNASSGGAASAGSGIMGGSLISPGGLGKVLNDHGVAWMRSYIKSGTYNLSTASLNVAGGSIDLSDNMINLATYIEGYETARGDFGARPFIDANGNAPAQMLDMAGTNSQTQVVANLHFDGDSQSINGIVGASVSVNFAVNCLVEHCDGAQGYLRVHSVNCKASSCGVAAHGFTSCKAFACWADACAGTAYNACDDPAMCIASNCNLGFIDSAQGCTNCATYNNTSHGFDEISDRAGTYVNCLSVIDGGFAFDTSPESVLLNCASYNIASGRTNQGPIIDNNPVVLTGDPFTNAAGGVFSLDDTANQGAACRAAGISAFGQTEFQDIGAVQHEDAGGGGGGGTKLIGQGGGLIA